jgi:hypothetical protein
MWSSSWVDDELFAPCPNFGQGAVQQVNRVANEENLSTEGITWNY